MTTTSTRRAAPITIGYTAIRCEHIAPQTNEIRCVARRDMHIQGENGASVDLRAGETFYLVRAASLGPDMFYIVRLVMGAKRCSCPSRKPCKHEVRIAAIEAARESRVGHKQAALKPVPARSLAERGALNGSRGFSLLRR